MELVARGIFLGDKNEIERVYGGGRREIICKRIMCLNKIVNESNFKKLKEELKTVEYAFSTWGMPHFCAETVKEYFPNLKILFYAAGSVKSFATPFLNNNIRVVSAWAANAIPVAETVFAQILLANKGFFKILEKGDDRRFSAPFLGNYGTKTGIIAAGMIGSLICEKLKTINTEVYVYDPYISDERLKQMGAKRAELLELFEICDVISNHLPDTDETKGMLNYNHFSRMKPHAVFINSGRGRQVNEEDLCRAMKKEGGRTAILDVTYPEPPAKKSPLRKTPNIILTPHIDGSTGQEVWRMADYVIEELDNALSNKPLRWEITQQMLEKMA
jgi:phosphoglycerate dehydrogenase-like enzyme